MESTCSIQPFRTADIITNHAALTRRVFSDWSCCINDCMHLVHLLSDQSQTLKIKCECCKNKTAECTNKLLNNYVGIRY